MGWTKAEFDQCPELAARLHGEILDLRERADEALARTQRAEQRVGELEGALQVIRQARDRARAALSPNPQSEERLQSKE